MILRSYSLKERTANASFFFSPSQPQKNSVLSWQNLQGFERDKIHVGSHMETNMGRRKLSQINSWQQFLLRSRSHRTDWRLLPQQFLPSLSLSLSLSLSCSLSHHDTLQHNEAQRKELTSDSGFEPSTFLTSLHFSAIQGMSTPAFCILGFVASERMSPRPIWPDHVDPLPDRPSITGRERVWPLWSYLTTW